MWRLYTTAKTFSARPSALLGIENDWVAYCLDNAVSLLGNSFESKLMETNKEGKPKYTLDRLLLKEGKDSAKELEKWLGGFTQGFQRQGKAKKKRKK